jgi:anthranilate phosphoribosyltransferase
VELPRPPWFADALGTLLAGRELPPERVTELARDLLAGRVADGPAAALLVALRIKGETAGEIAAAAEALREQMVRLTPTRRPVVDTCGTGGDGTGTFNVSTAAALVVAGAGVSVVKHGNRAVSGKSGSADVLRELGVDVEAGPAWAQSCLDRLGFAFCYAPQFHPGMAHVGRLRRQLGIRTLFNLLGPLSNPAGADCQLLGVGDPALLDPLAGAAARLGVRRAVLVCGRDGLDEVTLAAPTRVRIVEGDAYTATEWTPADFGLGTVELTEVQADGPAASAATVRAVLANEDGPARRLVLANAAAALWAAGAVPTLKEGVARAEAAVSTGAAGRVLAGLTRHTP